MIIIFDFDGTVTLSSPLERVCRKFFGKISLHPPRLFLAVSELIDFIFFILGIKKIKIRDHIVKILKNGELPVGILTDRSKCSLCLYLKAIGIDKGRLVFVQARKSFFDFFSFCNCCDCNIISSPKIKPDASVYDNLIIFAEKMNLKLNKITVIDDLAMTRETAKKIGFSIIDPNIFNEPESSLV